MIQNLPLKNQLQVFDYNLSAFEKQILLDYGHWCFTIKEYSQKLETYISLTKDSIFPQHKKYFYQFTRNYYTFHELEELKQVQIHIKKLFRGSKLSSYIYIFEELQNIENVNLLYIDEYFREWNSKKKYLFYKDRTDLPTEKIKAINERNFIALINSNTQINDKRLNHFEQYIKNKKEVI